MRTSHAAVALGSLLALSTQHRIATACVLEPTLPHHLDATLAQVDTAAPRTPVVVEAMAYRRSGLTCGQDVCVANNCGDLGGVAIDLEAGRDDRTPSDRLGYRLELVDGEVPEQLRSLLGVNLAGPTPVRLHLAFDQVPAVNATLRIIALDEAGNESPPSQPFEVSFDGCTLAATGDQCESDYDADGEYAARHAQGGELSAGAGVAEGTGAGAVRDVELQLPTSPGGFAPPTSGVTGASVEQGGCSLPSSRPASGSALGALAALLVAGFARRWR